MEFQKYHKIRMLGDLDNKGILDEGELIVEEKMDGANFRFMFHGDNVIFGSRSQQLTSDDGEDTNIQKNFLRCVNFVRDTVKDVDKSLFQNTIFYGECMVKHTMNYNWDKVPPYLGFDIFNLELGEWVKYDVKKDVFDMLKLPMVPLIKRCKANELGELNDKLVPKSKYSEHQAEGIVIKNYSKGLFAKYVREKFKEDNRKTFGEIKKYAKTDDDYLTAAYCTNARIDKNIFKLIDDGHKLEMSLMKHLPPKVYKDIWEEHWDEIINMRGRSCNFFQFKKLVTSRCLNVLKQMIINNSLN